MLKNTDGSELKYADLSEEELLLIESLESTMKERREGLILLAFESKKR